MKPWKDWFQPHILERGRVYFEEGRVSELERTEDGYVAIVEGTEEYEVEILLEGDSIEDMLCDCPYAEDGNTCKHMAAVLFAVDAEPSEKKAPTTKKRLTPAGLVEKIPDGQLRPLLTELISADEKLYRALLLRYGETTLDECMKTLKRELASIYRNSDDFECDIADFIQQQSQMLLGRGEPLPALRVGMDALREFASYEEEENCGYVDNAMDVMLTDILCACKEDAASEVFDFLLKSAGSAGEHWMVREFAEQAIFSRFSGEAFDKKKLEFVDRQIANLEASDKQSYSIEYEMARLLTRRFDLMKKLSRPKEEMDGFLERYTNYSDIRKLRIRQALDDRKTDEAIRLLEEGKSADRDKRGLVAEYSEWLMDLYERQGRHDKLLAELEYHVFTLSFGGMEMLGRLKKVCTPEQWVEYRERYLSGQNTHKLELMESEGLWERLMEAVVAAKRLSILDRYEAVLIKRYPDDMLDAYANILMKEAAAVSSRKQYQELARYLKKLRSYPSGAERTAQLAEDWRTRYGRRRAMMEELNKAGF